MKQNDEPTLHDLIGRTGLVKEVGDEVAACDPPQVFGVHGDWGCGKTSFLQQLHWYLTGECPESQEWSKEGKPNVPEWQAWKPQAHVTVVWFEAWRYQHETNPVVALLQAIRMQLQVSRKVWNYAKKEAEVAAYGALFGLESITKYLGVKPSEAHKEGERWEREHCAVQLPTHVVRALLEKSIGQLLGANQRKKPPQRLVVLIDDLDRCDSRTAYRLLEGIKIYLNIPNCVFVLGMDQRLIQLGVAENIPGLDDGDKRVLAEEYIEKICRRIWYLPQLQDCANLLKHFTQTLRGAEDICAIVDAYHCLPANSRKVKAFANTLERFLKYTGYEDISQPMSPLTPQAGVELSGYAGLITVMACLYHFHYEIYRLIEGYPSYYHKVREWAEGKNEDKRLEALTRIREPGQVDPKPATKEPEMELSYADPMRGNVFRIQQLMCELGEVRIDLIEGCILGRSVT